MSRMYLDPGETIHFYIIDGIIGNGSYSTVYKAKHLMTNEYVAIKQIWKNKTNPEIFSREMSILKQIDHPFAAMLYDGFEDDENYYIVTEYIEGETLLSYLQNYSPLPEWKIQHIFIELISCLHYLHTVLSLVHRDLRLENIMIDKYGNIRLIDFGLGNFYGGHSQLLKTRCGYLSFISPEMLRGEEYTSLTDIWSVGIILYVLAVGKMPFEDSNSVALMSKILTSEPFYPSLLSPQLTQLIQHLLIKENVQRASYTYIFQHLWVKQVPNSKYILEVFGTEAEWKTKTFTDHQVIKKMVDLGFKPAEIIANIASNNSNEKTVSAIILSRTNLIERLGKFTSMPKFIPKYAMHIPTRRSTMIAINHSPQVTLLESKANKSVSSFFNTRAKIYVEEEKPIVKSTPKFVIPSPVGVKKKYRTHIV